MAYEKIAYNNQYNKENYTAITIRLQKGKKEIIEEHRKAKGYKSLNSYVTNLIDQDIAKSYGGVLRIIEKLFRKFTPSASCCHVSCLNIKKYIDFENCICYNANRQLDRKYTQYKKALEGRVSRAIVI